MEEKTEASQIIHTYPLCKFSDMPDEMKQEVMEVCITAIEKFSDNYEKAARFVKEALDKKYDPSFQVVIGESFAFEITYQNKTLLKMFIGGNVAALVWKTVSVY